MEELPDQIVELIVRFTQSLSDISLQFDEPQTTTTLSVKQSIRAELPAAYNTRRLRLIYAGKVLPDKDSLFASLNLATQRGSSNDDKADKKGKQPLRNRPGPTAVKLYIHCSIGDVLSSKELSDEATAAKEADLALQVPTGESLRGTAESSSPPPVAGAGRSAPAGLRGFDRLMATGFSAAEVASLRSQFLNVLSHTHTPDNMPSGSALLALEDRWLDNDSTTSGANGRPGEAEGEAWGADDGTALDDFLWGNVTGFFWPLGALVWGFREEGVWTRRRQIAVFTGLLINLVFGFARLTA